MLTPIHHATQKAAAKAGLQIEAIDGAFRVTRLTDNRFCVVQNDTAKGALAAAINAEGVVTWQKPIKAFCGVMRFAYHDRYEHNPHGPGCGDGLDVAMRDAFMDPDTEKLRTGPMKELGESLDLWNPAWDSLNPGMQRMNLTNRIRAFLRNNADEKVEIGGKRSRFGVPFMPAKRNRKG